MIVFYIIIAVFVAWIWIEYFRMIDLFEKEKLKHLIITFLLGALSVLFVYATFYIEKHLIKDFYFELGGGFVNDFLYSFLKIGVKEEIAKLIPFLIIYYLIPHELNEPVDYLIYISVSALGFSAAENLLYMINYGVEVIDSRAILCSVGHMFDSALIAYGVILHKYKQKHFVYVILFFVLAALSHGFYDFWLMYDGVTGGWLITLTYFMVTVSWFSTILNNALNNSSFFTYKKVIDSGEVTSKLLIYYVFVYIAQFVLISVEDGAGHAAGDLLSGVFRVWPIIIITVIRLSRFKLIQGRWNNIKLELPFSVDLSDFGSMTRRNVRVTVKGDSYNEALVNKFYQEHALLIPMTKWRSYLKVKRKVYIERKIFLKKDATFFVAKVFYGEVTGEGEWMLLKPKNVGASSAKGGYPIVAVLKIDDMADLENTSLSARDFKFREWACLKPIA